MMSKRAKGAKGTYSGAEVACLKGHIEKNFGGYVVRPDDPDEGFPLEIAIVGPSSDFDLYTLITIGAGARKRKVSPETEDEDFERAEFMMCLPSDWDVNSEEDEWRWPFDWLKAMAVFSADPSEPIAWGEIPNIPFPAGGAGFTAAALMPPLVFSEEAHACRLPNGDDVFICQMIPLYEGEKEYAEENDIIELLELMDPEDLGCLNSERENVCEGNFIPDLSAAFTERAEQFWDWFSENEAELSAAFDLISDDADAEIPEEIPKILGKGLRLVSSDLFVEIGGVREFNFSIDSSEYLFYILPHLTAKMPDEYKEKWKIGPYALGYDGVPETGPEPEEDMIMVSLEKNGEGGGLVLGFYSKELSGFVAYEELKLPLLRAMMCSVTGDLLPYLCISDYKELKEPAEGMFPIIELKKKLEDFASETGKAADPSDHFITYEFEPESNKELRRDITKGVTCYPELIYDYIGNDYSIHSGSAKFGAAPCFLFFPADGKDRDALLKECELIMRTVETLALDPKWCGDETGIVLGYAAGEMGGYIDLMLFSKWDFMDDADGALRFFGRTFFLFEFSEYRDDAFLCTGNGADMIRDLDLLKANEAYDLIRETIEGSTGEDDLGYDLALRYAESLCHTFDLEYALELLEKMMGEGKDDARWNAAMGVTLFFLEKQKKAETYLQRAADLGDGSEMTMRFLGMCQTAKGKGKGKAGKKKG
jgi:hypothetical protein